MESDYPKLSDAFHLTKEQKAFVNQAGAFWRTARQSAGLSRFQMAERLGIDLSLRTHLALFENGEFSPDTYSGGLPQHYAQALGKPELFSEFCQKFGLAQDSTYA